MELQLVPVDRETGEALVLSPQLLPQLENDDLAGLLSNLKTLDRLKKEAEKEVKKRLDKGEQFVRFVVRRKESTTNSSIG